MNERLNKIENSCTFQEENIERLSEEVRKQQIEIKELQKEIKAIYGLILQSDSGVDVGEEIPPHY
ncbi:MAG: SlyX family protein [SAR86 cluster bacterium]|jgi:uncharacterized coiled-coil protein SlyX|nr:SlyX family protein [SAR86 cluster bacterium]|tara:strand:- start:2292 stop:2486 length:195 start_codon:yes stop_codon:yes gene_type:complete